MRKGLAWGKRRDWKRAGRRGPLPALPPSSAPRTPVFAWRPTACTSASDPSRFSFFLSGWKDGVPQGRHRLCHHLFQLHHWRGRERQRQRRVWRFGREASADRWFGEWASVSSGPHGSVVPSPVPPEALPGSLPTPGLVSLGQGFPLTPSFFIFTFCSGDATAFSAIWRAFEACERGPRLGGVTDSWGLFWDTWERGFGERLFRKTTRWRRCREGFRTPGLLEGENKES